MFCSECLAPDKPLVRQIVCRLLHFSSASIFKVLQCRSEFVRLLPWFQTSCIRIRRRVSRRLIRIQDICIILLWIKSCDWRTKGKRLCIYKAWDHGPLACQSPAFIGSFIYEQP